AQAIHGRPLPGSIDYSSQFPAKESREIQGLPRLWFPDAAPPPSSGHAIQHVA
ncbi:Hypothetical predicted protein, partial [Pelobates cultripes]